jgi:hypothetical protein
VFQALSNEHAMRRREVSDVAKAPLGVILLVLLVIVVSFVSFRSWIHGADHRDFYPRWAGARRIVEGDRDIYSVEATKAMQVRLYGAEIAEGRDQQGFAYPAIVLPFLIPFALINDVEIATAIWEGLTVALLIGSMHLYQKALDVRVSYLPVLLLILWSYTLLMVFQGQITGLVLFSLGAGYWAYRRRADFIAGVFLSIGLVKPELVLLPIAFLAIWTMRNRRFGMALGMAAGIIVMFALSLLLIGWWVDDWLAALIRYTEYARVVWPVGFVWNISPIFLAALTTFVVWGFYKSKWDEEGLFAITMPFQLLLFPQTLLWSLSILCLPLNFAWKQRARAGVLVIWILGWVLILLNVSSEWWKYQIVAVALSTVILLYSLHISRARNPRNLKSKDS